MLEDIKKIEKFTTNWLKPEKKNYWICVVCNKKLKSGETHSHTKHIYTSNSITYSTDY